VGALLKYIIKLFPKGEGLGVERGGSLVKLDLLHSMVDSPDLDDKLGHGERIGNECFLASSLLSVL